MDEMQMVPRGFDAANAPNSEDIEKQFAVKCMEHAETYWNLITGIQPAKLKLTKHDDALASTFLEAFPEYKESEKLAVIRDDDIKSVAMKNRWRTFFKEWEKTLEDYNFGTLLRSDCRQDYSESNSIFVLRIQFLIFEILRNRTGLNDHVYKQATSSK